MYVGIDVTDVMHIDLNLHSKYTCIYGFESNEKKSMLIAMYNLGLDLGRLTVTSEYPLIIYNTGQPFAENKSIYIVDELSFYNADTLNQFNKSNHLFIVLSRSPVANLIPYAGIYHMVDTNGYLSVQQAEDLRTIRSLPPITRVITESIEMHSEYEMLSRHFRVPIIAARGSAKLGRIIEHHYIPGTLVLCDLGNIGGAYARLCKLCVKYPELYIYDYDAFEQLLCESPVLPTEFSINDDDMYQYPTLERYYEEKAEELTKGTIYEYKHGKKLAEAWLDKSKTNIIFDSDAGRGLLSLPRGLSKEYVRSYIQTRMSYKGYANKETVSKMISEFAKMYPDAMAEELGVADNETLRCYLFLRTEEDVDYDVKEIRSLC